MTKTIPVTIAAKNEEAALATCLRSTLVSVRHAEARLPWKFDVLVVCDDCTDATMSIAGSFAHEGVRVTESTGGKVEAQRKGLREGPFQIFHDADVLVAEDTFLAVTKTMLEDPSVYVAFPPLRPLPPRRRTLLARALHAYNATRGWSSQRSWFNGRFFAMREWRAPTLVELEPSLRSMPDDAFLDLHSGLVADDVYLSRDVVMRFGVAALRETPVGCVQFRAPETWVGMYRYYRRLRREIERIDALFPQTREVHASFGSRRSDLLATAPWKDRALHAVFSLALLPCRLGYRLDRAYHRRSSASKGRGRGQGDSWKPIAESKRL